MDIIKIVGEKPKREAKLNDERISFVIVFAAGCRSVAVQASITFRRIPLLITVPLNPLIEWVNEYAIRNT